MGEKRVFEGLVMDCKVNGPHIVGADGVPLGIVMMRDILEGFEGRRVRITAEALPRTIAYMARAFKVQKSTVNQHVLAMLNENLLQVHSVPLQTRGRGSYSYVYVLTPEGQLLAEAIRRRAA